MGAHGESIVLLSEDGKVLPRTSWSGSHGKDYHTVTLQITPHTIDPGSTQLSIEYPTGLKVLPVDLTFTDVPIRDVKLREEQ